MIKQLHIWIRKHQAKGNRHPATPATHTPPVQSSSATTFPHKSALYRPLDDYSDEELLIALIEGDLQTADREKVLRRIKRSTTLQQLYHQLQRTRIRPRPQMHFPRKAELYQSAQDFDELILALIDGTITDSEKSMLHSKWTQDTIQRAIRLYRSLHLRPNEHIIYPFKNRLKRHGRSTVRWYPLSAAAAITALLAFGFPSSNIPRSSSPKAQPKPPRPHITSTTRSERITPSDIQPTPPSTDLAAFDHTISATDPTHTAHPKPSVSRRHSPSLQSPPEKQTPPASSTISAIPLLPSAALSPLYDASRHAKEVLPLPTTALHTSADEPTIPIAVEITSPYIKLWKSLLKSRQNFLRGKRQNRLILTFDYGPIAFYRSVEI